MSSQRELYQGYALQAIDGKGRVAIPAILRSALEHNSAEKTLMIGDHEVDPCVTAYDRERSYLLQAEMEDQIQQKRNRGEAVNPHNIRRLNFTNVDPVAFDSSGRFIVPPFIRDFAKLEDLAFFAGNGATFEIWNPHVLMKTANVEPGTVKRCAWLMQQRGIA